MKDICWIASSKKDLKELPDEVKRFFGYGLREAQKGLKHTDAKVLKGLGNADIIELIDIDTSGTYRAVYTVKMKEVVFVLHVFQKKSKHGIATPKQDIDIIKSRLKIAEEMYKNRKKS